MAKCPIGQVQAGSVLDQPALLSDGRVLLNKGVELTADKILQLKARGVALVSVVDEESAEVEQASEPKALASDELKAIVLDTSLRFGDTRGNEVMDALFHAVIRRATQGRVG